MNKFITTTALLGLVGAYPCPAHAELAGQNATTDYASQLAPIYPTPDQQTGAMWGTTEVVRCPEGYGLVFSQTAAGTQSPPICKPIPTANAGGMQ